MILFFPRYLVLTRHNEERRVLGNRTRFSLDKRGPGINDRINEGKGSPIS